MKRHEDHDELQAALSRCGATWNAPQAHGLIAAGLAVAGDAAAPRVAAAVLEGTDPANALRGECAAVLARVFDETRDALRERQSGFQLLLPDDDASNDRRAGGLAAWCEGFLHGLVAGAGAENTELRERLARDPLADVIADLLQITRAGSDADADAEDEEEAYAELVEYLRVAAQLVYEELADLRPAPAT